jgi:hypothetical protein
MLSRCYKQSDSAYKNYGGRGIEVCERWRESFKNFYEDMGGRPEGLSLGRIDNEGNYEPNNCCWETREQQNQNMRKRSDNKSGLVGLHFDNHQKIWRARRQRNGIIYELYSGKCFESAKQAILTFNHGELK